MNERDAQVISIERQRAARSSETSSSPNRDRERCGARTRSGRPCRNHPVSEGRCRLHPDHETRGDEPTAHAGAHGRETDAAWVDAAEELRARGLGPPVDALAVLAEFVDERWGEVLREVGEFLLRRRDGDYVIDEFGFDEDLTTNLVLPLLRPLHQRYWRVASHGAEHLPARGAAVLAANHAGTFPLDALMARLDVFEHTGRHARELGADLVFRTPFVAEFARKTGVTRASEEDADRLLSSGELVAVWPEGYKGLGKSWSDRYTLQRFGRGGFVAAALRAKAPIIPTAIVGSEEIYPLLFDLRLVARLLDLPYLPIVAQMFALPLIGPFALLPLPSKWIIEYGEPIDTSLLPSGAVDDPMTVFELTDRVRGTIQGMLDRNLRERRSAFH